MYFNNNIIYLINQIINEKAVKNISSTTPCKAIISQILIQQQFDFIYLIY